MFKKKLLNKAIMATVLGGMMLAPNFALGATITGNSSDSITNVTVGSKNNQANVKNIKTNYVSYTVSNNATVDGISLDGKNAYISGSKKSLTISDHSGSGEQAAVSVVNGADLYTYATTATNLLTLNLGSVTSTDGVAYGYKIVGSNAWIAGAKNITLVSGQTGAYGLYVDNSLVTDYVTTAQSIKIGSKSGDTISYGVQTTATGNDKAAGIYAVNGSSVLLQKVEEYVKGNGVVAKGGSKVALGSDKSGTVTVYVDKTNTDDYAALLADGDSSQIDVGLKDTWKTGTFTFGAISNGYQDNINGNIVVKNNGTVNLSLTKSTSTWEGVAYNNGGTINLWLQNGGTWTNEKWGDQTGFNGSHITNLTGGAAGTEGIIMMKDTNALTIDKLDGMVKVFYAHTNDGDEASDYAGDIKINSANASTSITLITDKTGIDMANNTVVEAALMALSGKLYYLGYTTGEDNLAGYVQIAEGLTASSAMLKAGNIAFDNSTGKGSYEPDVYKTAQTKFALGNVITGVVDNDKAYKKAGILREDGKYHLDGDTTITLTGNGTTYSVITNTDNVVIEGAGHDLTLNVNGDATTQYGISQEGKDKSITITVDNLNINNVGAKRVEGIHVKNTDIDNPTTMNVNGNVNIYANAGATALMGVLAYANSYLNIDGNLTIKNPDATDGKWGTNAYGTNGKTIGNTYFGNAAVYVQSGLNACQMSGGVNITGDVDIIAGGHGLYINGGGGVINISGGGYIENDPTIYVTGSVGGMMGGETSYSAMRAEDGYIYMNVTKDTAGVVKGNVTGAGNKKVTILGNLAVTCGADNASLDPNHYESFINLGLNTSDSSWKGVAYNAYTNTTTGAVPFRGEINLWLANGATWTNEKYGRIGENPYAGLKFSGNEGDKAVYDGSRINKLVGGSSADNSGIIFQNDTNPLTIDSYSGNTKVFYAHINDGDEATDYAAGDIKIKSAATGSAITLITNNEGIASVGKADATLNALAGKLIYAAYADGEKNLSGKVEIAEGLTASSASLRLEQIDFDAENGKGKLHDPYQAEQKVFEFTAPILGNPETDIAYIEGGVLRKNGIYTFDGDTTIDSAGASVEKGLYGSAGTAIIDASSVNQNTVLDLQGHNLTVTGKTAAGLIDIMATGVVDSNTKQLNIGIVEIRNPGQIVLEASRTGASGYPTPLYVNGGGKIVIHNGEGDLVKKVVTIKSETPNNDQFCGIKTMNGVKDGRSQVIIDGLVDIETSAYRENPGTNIEGISNVASTVSVGGGTIKLNNDDGTGKKGNGIWAIRSYGEFTSSNPGYVYFNAVHDGVEGAATGSGKNKAVIEGGIGMSGSMNVIGSINVGFGTADSYFKGDVRSTGSYGAAQGNGAVNLWFTPGSYWEGDNISAGHDTNVYLDSASWTGKSTQVSGTTKAGAPIGFNLDMKNGSVWNNTGDSLLLSLSGSGSAINMANAGAGNVTIDNYSGNTKVFYAHNNDGDEATDYAAGDITIKAAATGSTITLITDNTGISDVTKADATLNALAGKLIYSAYVTGEKNLSGKVEIAEGLTSSSISLRLEDMTFDEESGQGMYEAAEPSEKQTVFDYDAAIDNNEADDQEYVDGGVRRADGTYKMDGNTTIALKDVAVANSYIMNSNKNDLTINAGNNELKTSIDGTKQIYGILQNDNKQIDITASKFTANVTSTGRTEAISVTNTDADKKAVININADTYLTANAGSGAAMGIHATCNSEVNINGNLTMKGDGEHPWGVALEKGGYSYFGAAALYSHNNYGDLQKSGDINVNGLVDIEAYANGAYVNGGGGTINIAGGSIKMNKEDTAKGYAALRAESGHINMNMNADNSAAGTNKVNILGNVDTTAGAYNLTLEPCEESVVNLGMSTEDSTWTGVAYNAFPDDGMGGTAGSGTWKGQERNFTGAINLWLENGATWNNELYGITENAYAGKNFEGSHLAKLTGGNSAANAGIIFQKDANPLTIDAYSGNTKVFYAHINDGDEATDYAAGDITIKAAATGSVITLITDNTGISDVAKADATLAALAGKLIYSAYVTGEKNLSGKVEIAEGLTSSSISLRLEDMTFDEESGQGYYEKILPPGPGPDPDDPIDSTGKILTGTMNDKSFMKSKISESGDQVNYDLTKEDYTFLAYRADAGSKSVANLAPEGTLTLGGEDANGLAMLINDGADVTVNGNLKLSAFSESYGASGISMMVGGTGVGAESHLTINGKVTMGTDDDNPGIVAEDKHGAYGFYAGTRWTGAGINMNQGHGSTITITKGLEIYADGHGIVTDPYYCDKKYADKDLAVVTVNGPTTIHVGSDEDVGLYALANYGGTININMKNGQPGTDKVDILGNAIVMKDTIGEEKNPYFYRSGEINLALTTADSLWTGAVDNTGTTQVGDFNLYLQNGGTWNYQNASKMDGLSASTMPTPSISYYGVYDGVSHIAKLTGGSDAASRGVIMINSDDTLAIANYSGNVLVAYEHDEVSPTTIYGGDIKIAKAKVGSVITLFTNNVGVDGSNYTAVLNALAGKLYYTGGDEALIGQVQIGEGLTSQSMTYEGYIAYGANGQGKYTSEKGTTVVENPIGEGTEDGAFKVEETDDAKTIKMDDKPKMVSVETGSALKNSGDKPLIIDNPQATLVLQSADTNSPVVAATSGNVTIKGAVEVIGVPGQKLIEVGEGKKVVIDGAEMSNAIAGSGDGTVSNPAIDMKDGSSIYIGEYVNSSNEKVFSKRDVQFIGDVQNTRGSFNIALMTDRSYWDGDYQNEDAKFNIDINSHGAKWSGSANGDVINVNLTQGTWVNMGASSSTGNNFTLKGGGAGKAFLDMSNASSGNVTIDNYSGGMTIIYGHEAATPTTIPGGTVRVVNAAQGSVINMMTLNAGVDMSNPDSILDTMDAVANKLLYTNYATEGNIKGTVGIGEGLTRPTMVSHIADYKFDAEPASIDRSTLRDTFAHGEIVYGDTETAMMRGAKMAMASTAMIWRAEANDLTKRMGDLQLRKEEAGVWAKYYSGRQEYNNNGSFSNKYKAVQVGVDKSLGHGWLGGIALSYDAGNGSLNNGGSSDNKVQSLGFYGTKVNKNGEYVDLIGKFSRLENEYTVYNDYGYSLDGDYKNFGMSVSAEYGKHIKLKNGLVLTPAVEFTLGRVNSKNYDAYSEYYEKSMTVKQDAFNSAIGRIGVSIGKETATYSYYAKLGLAHEFAGGFDTTYSAPGEPTSGTSINFKDTWKEVQIGGSVKLKNDALLYGSFSKSFGGDVTEKWRIDAGMMFTFNHISDFFGGRKKTEAAAVVAETPTANLIETTAPVEEKNYTAETAAVADANGDRNASVKVGDTEVGATMPASKISKGAFMLDEYVVTASRTKQRITDAKADVSVVTRTEIEAMHMNSVEEVLRTVPGVQFNNYGSGNQMNANISSLRINGSKDVALLVDGVKINDFQGAGESGNMYAGVLNNMNNIERIEVLRGAAGVLYGSGAKGGVINIITREITENKTIADASIGSFGRKDTKFSTMGKAGKLTYNFSQGTFKQGDVTDGNGDKWEGHTNTHNFGGKVTYSFTDNHKLTLDYMDINSNFGGTDLIYSNYYNGKYESTMWSIRDDWQINKNWSNTFVYRQNEEKRQHQQQYFAGNVLKNSDTDFKYTFISDQISFHNNRHNLVMGVDYSQGEDQNYTLVNGRNVKREMKNTSFYISEDWTIVPHVTLSGGLRHDRPKEDKYGSKIDSHTTKSYKLAWDVTKKDTVYAGRSEYFILPSMSQLYDKEWGNEGLKPAEGRTESIGYNKKFDDNNFLTVNYFQTKENCGIGWNGYNRVNTSGISRGWNAQFTSRLSDKWSFNVGWSHLYERSDGDDNYTLGYYPRDLATFGVYYNVGKFDAGLDGYWFFRRKDDSGRREFPADNYGIYNLSMNYKPTKNMKMYCKVENIFNKYYAEHTDAGTDPYLTGTGERKYYAMPGRAFMVGLEFNF